MSRERDKDVLRWQYGYIYNFQIINLKYNKKNIDFY